MSKPAPSQTVIEHVMDHVKLPSDPLFLKQMGISEAYGKLSTKQWQHMLVQVDDPISEPALAQATQKVARKIPNDKKTQGHYVQALMEHRVRNSLVKSARLRHQYDGFSDQVASNLHLIQTLPEKEQKPMVLDLSKCPCHLQHPDFLLQDAVQPTVLTMLRKAALQNEHNGQCISVQMKTLPGGSAKICHEQVTLILSDASAQDTTFSFVLQGQVSGSVLAIEKITIHPVDTKADITHTHRLVSVLRSCLHQGFADASLSEIFRPLEHLQHLEVQPLPAWWCFDNSKVEAKQQIVSNRIEDTPQQDAQVRSSRP